jgi:hypothetical protein
MSARLIAVLILPTLALAPIRAAQQPPEAVKPDKTAKSDKTQMVTRVYQVTDLVIPLANPDTSLVFSAPCKFKCENGEWMILGDDAYKPNATANEACKDSCRSCPEKTAPKAKAPTPTCEDKLIQLIKTAIAPSIWNDAGGPAAVEYFPLTHALVVTAPVDIQEQVQDVLCALRRLQDQEVAIEVRFMTLSDECYARLKADFGLKAGKDGPLASFDEKQLRRFAEATQSDVGTQVMQAPKITLFNGQRSAIRILEQRFFTTGLQFLRVGEELTPVPVNEPTSIGLQMALQPTVSTDRRFVALNLKCENTRLEAENVELVPVVYVSKQEPDSRCRDGYLKVFPAVDSPEKMPQMFKDEIDSLKDKKAVVTTQFLQKPRIAQNRLETKLNLPEGKTAVLFGWKQTSEVTDNVPVLSKLPYIGKNYQHKRQVPETVLVLVTPRVIVPQEEEERQTGLTPVPVKPAPTASGDAEESEGPPCVAELLAKYHKACAAGKKDAARKIAIKALKIDPTCFDRK